MLRLHGFILIVVYCQANVTSPEKGGDNLNVSATTHSAVNETASQSSATAASDYLMDVVYWEQKPFIFHNKKGEIDGIIPQLFEQAQAYCLANNGTIKINNYVRKLKDRRHFYDLVRSDVDYGDGELRGIRKTNVFWVPVVASFQLMKSSEIAVIVQRDLISLPNKIIRGILSCQQIFFLGILMAILFGLVLWIIERHQNQELPTSFIKGMGSGLYWSIVSMTTVGYGDVTPKNPLGRFLACIWLFVGVMVGCVMTATMTDVVTGVDDLNVLSQRVSVLEDSIEERTVEKGYRAKVVPVKSYEEVLDFVRQGKVYAGMMNADVAAWYQDEINDDSASVPLRIVQKLPANLYINCYLPTDLATEMKKIFKCMYFFKDEVYAYSIEAFQQYCHTDTLYIGSMSDLIFHNIYVQILLGAVCGLMLVGIGYDLLNYWYDVKNTGEQEEEKKEQAKLMEEKTDFRSRFNERLPHF